MKKRILILKNSSIKIKIYSEYMIIKSFTHNEVVAFRYIDELYINKNISISLSDIVKLATHFKVYLIDHNGYILANIKIENETT